MSPGVPNSRRTMSQITVSISMSLDGFVAGPNQTLEHPLGENGMLLHEWVFGLATWRAQHGLEGGVHDADDELVAASLRSQGAVVMGRRMFSSGQGAWEDDPNAGGWWGDDPPFGIPVFVLTHHPRETLVLGSTTFTFVTEGIDAAVEQARAVAAEKDISIAGGASVVQQCLRAGLVDELQIHLAPVLLGGGVRLFDGADFEQLELGEVVASPTVTHLTFRSADEKRERDHGGGG
jgi:dihydrofolate reductase